MGYQLTKVKFGVIGYGGSFSMGKQHADAAIKYGMEIGAICDANADRAASAEADFPGVSFTTDYREILSNPDIDLVLIILPHNLHAPVAIEALNAGKHVVTEKPMCNTLEEADAMCAAAVRNDRMLSIYHNRRWDGDFNTIRELINKGTIGELFQIEAKLEGMHGPWGTWRDDKAISGGSLLDWGAHIVDWFFHYYAGDEVAAVDGYFHKLRWFDKTNEDHTSATLRFKSGKTANVELSSIAAYQGDRFRFLGTKGAIRVEMWNKITVYVDVDGHIASFEVKPRADEGFRYYENVAGHLMKGEELVVKAEEGRRIISILMAAEESAKLGRSVVPKYA
jgi:predicted dehydrogenase